MPIKAKANDIINKLDGLPSNTDRLSYLQLLLQNKYINTHSADHESDRTAYPHNEGGDLSSAFIESNQDSMAPSNNVQVTISQSSALRAKLAMLQNEGHFINTLADTDNVWIVTINPDANKLEQRHLVAICPLAEPLSSATDTLAFLSNNSKEMKYFSNASRLNQLKSKFIVFLAQGGDQNNVSFPLIFLAMTTFFLYNLKVNDQPENKSDSLEIARILTITSIVSLLPAARKVLTKAYANWIQTLQMALLSASPKMDPRLKHSFNDAYVRRVLTCFIQTISFFLLPVVIVSKAIKDNAVLSDDFYNHFGEGNFQYFWFVAMNIALNFITRLTVHHWIAPELRELHQLNKNTALVQQQHRFQMLDTAFGLTKTRYQNNQAYNSANGLKKLSFLGHKARECYYFFRDHTIGGNAAPKDAVVAIPLPEKRAEYANYGDEEHNTGEHDNTITDNIPVATVVGFG